MVIAPVPVLRAKPVAHVPTCETVAVPDAPRTMAAEPFTLSLATMSAIGVDGVPDTAVPFSNTGRMSAVIVMIAVASSQLAGLFLSQSAYFTV